MFIIYIVFYFVLIHMLSHHNVIVVFLKFTDSGVGAGIDSYYEYCLKAYVLLGDQTYLQRFSKASALIYTYY